MADAGAQILELRLGRGEPSSIPLARGTVVDPTSVGTAGMWRIEAQGVLDVHGYVYFDGKSLFVQSADDKAPIMVNKHRVATAWTEVRAPSTIEIGKAELVYRDADAPPASYDDGDETVAAAAPPPQAALASPARATAPQAFVPGGGAFTNRADDESTRFAPIEGMPIPAARPSQSTRLDPLEGPSTNRAPLARPAAGSPAMDFPPPQMEFSDQPMPMMGGDMPGMQDAMGMQGGMPPGMQGLPPGMQGMPPGMQGWNGGPMGTGPQAAVQGQAGVATEKKGWAKFKAEWEALPPMRRALYIMAPFTFSAACFLLFFDDPVVEVPRPKTAPSSSASGRAAGSASGSPSGSAIASGAPSSSASPSATSSGASIASGVGSTPTPPVLSATTAKTADPAPTVAVKAEAGVSVPPTAPGKKTTERLAADAWAEGNYGEAARLYDELAAANPGNPAYREAARILREKAPPPPGR